MNHRDTEEDEKESFFYKIILFFIIFLCVSVVNYACLSVEAAQQAFEAVAEIA